ncbi:MAG: hypothetical protein AAGA48_02735 [Myxococcota bacterium]
MLEPLIVGALTGLTSVVGLAYWQSMVRPAALLTLWSDPDQTFEPWYDRPPAAVRALRWALGMGLALCGFVTGLVLTLLLATP